MECVSVSAGPITTDNISIGELIAERYRVEEIMGEAAFSVAVAAHDTFTGVDVCLKIYKNSKSIFDQGLDEIRTLAAINKLDPDGSKSRILRLVDFFYFQERLVLVLELLKANLFEVWKHNSLMLSSGPWFTIRRLQRIAYQVEVGQGRKKDGGLGSFFPFEPASDLSVCTYALRAWKTSRFCKAFDFYTKK